MSARKHYLRQAQSLGCWLLMPCFCLATLLVTVAADAGQFKGNIKVGVPLPLMGRQGLEVMFTPSWV